MSLTFTKIRSDFPLINDDYIYFDSAATMQKPREVLEAVDNYYKNENANPSRGLYDLSLRAQENLEHSRQVVADFIGASSKDEIIFTKNATESLNLIALSLSQFLDPADEILVSLGEHHSNLLPWLHLKSPKIRIIPCSQYGMVTPEILLSNITKSTKAIAFSAMSNITGKKADLVNITKIAKENHILTIVDATQYIAHDQINVENIDFLAFSGHKIGAPMGIGILYGKKHLLEDLPPIFFGGGAVNHVEINLPIDHPLRSKTHSTGVVNTTTFKTELKSAPAKFEPGTINVGGTVGLAAAISYWQKIGIKKINLYLDELSDTMVKLTKSIPDLEVYFLENGLMTFNFKDLHPHDLVTFLNHQQISVRAGFHCAEPLLNFLKIGPCVRASFAPYNTKSEIEKFSIALQKIHQQIYHKSKNV